MEISAAKGIEVTEGALPQDLLRQADEVFISSTAGGVMPVTSIDGTFVADGAVGAITQKITQTYWDWHKDARFADAVSYPADWCS